MKFDLVENLFAILFGSSWLYHIFHCMVVGKFAFLLLGLIIWPIGILHGLYLIFFA